MLGTTLFLPRAESSPVQPKKTGANSKDLQVIQQEVNRLEFGMQNAKKQEASLSADLQKLEKLLKLQALEIQLSTIELEKLEERVQEMSSRRDSLSESIENHKRRLRALFSVLPTFESKNPFARLTEENKIYILQYREVVARLLREDREQILALKKVLDEVESLNAKLEDERDRLVAHTEDLKEKQEILALNKNLKKQLIKRNHREQIERLQAYQAAKAAESELETMMSKLNIAAEIRKKEEPISIPIPRGFSFAAQRGKLPMPSSGQIVGVFGRKYDAATSLYTFHKGVDIQSGADVPVRAVFSGKVVYSGRIGGYGQLLILDHGDQYYSLVGQLGTAVKKEGDTVAAGETIGKSAADNTPVYFEIRQRHIAVNPVPWFALK